MGRKIPGKKHRGVKDPLKQQEERFNKIKSFINAPPSNPNDQEVPKSLIDLNRLRDLAKNGNKVGKKKKFVVNNKTSSENRKNDAGRAERSFPSVKQRPGESDTSFLWRIDAATNQILNEVRMEEKMNFNSEEKKNIRTNKDGDLLKDNPFIVHKKKKKLLKLSRSENLAVQSTGERLMKQKERLQLRKLTKRLKKTKGREDLEEKWVDKVGFGEVADRPPQLSKRPRGCPQSSDRPGGKNLLLKKFLPDTPQRSMSQMKMLAEERERVVQAYRDLKARKRQEAK